MAFATLETVQNTAAAGAGGVLGTALSGSVAVGDWISIELTTPNNDTDCITGVNCDKAAAGAMTRIIASDSQGMGERVYIYGCECTSAGVPAISVPNSSGSSIKYSLSRGTKPAGTFSMTGFKADSASGTSEVSATGVAANSMIRGACVSSSSRTAPSGFTTMMNDGSWNFEHTDYIDDAGAAGTKTVTWPTGAVQFTAAVAVFSVASSSPVLSGATPSGTVGNATAVITGAASDQPSGTGYVVIDSASNLSGVTASQIKAGQKASGAAAAASGSVAVLGATFQMLVTGLTAGTAYSYALVQNNTNGDSNVVTGTFTTPLNSEIPVTSVFPVGFYE